VGLGSVDLAQAALVDGLAQELGLPAEPVLEADRQAINFAIDRKALLSSFILDRGTQTEQIWGKSTKGYDESLESTYSYDPAKSKALLAEAGYADGFDIQLPTVPQFDATMMASIVQMLKDVGIRATLKDVPFADFFTQLRKGQWPVTYMIFFQPSDWQVVNQFIDAKAPWNPFHSTDATVAQLIEKMKTGTDADFAQASKDLNKYMVDQAWFAPFYRVQQQSFSDAKTVVEPQAEQAAPSIYNYSPKK
jgi:peptide/nickel transport system substrate-binding protein